MQSCPYCGHPQTPTHNINDDEPCLEVCAECRSQEPTHRVMVSQRVWSFLEGTQAWADHRSMKAGLTGSEGTHPDDASLIAKIYDAPAPTRKDGRFPVELTRDELVALQRYMEAFREGAADNTWDSDGRADLFAANAILTAIRKVQS